MPIDPSIPLQVKPFNIQLPVNQLAAVGEAMKIGEMNRGIDTQNKLRDLYSQGIDVGTPEGFRQVAAIDPATALKLRTDALQGQKLQGDIKKTGVETQAKQLEVQREQFGNLVFNPSNANVTAHIEDSVLKGNMPAAQAQSLLAQVMPMNVDQRKQFFTDMGIKAETRYQGDISKRGQDISAATTTRGQNMTYGATIRGQNLSNDPELQARIAAGRASGTEYGKAGAQANIALPGAIATGEEAIRKIDALVGSAPIKNAEGKVIQAGTKPAAGFEQAVGLGIPGLKYVPGSSVADFNARLNEVQGGAFLQAFNTLRGGGSITEKEGEKGTQAINRMSTAQSEKEFNIAAREYQDVIRTGIARAKAKAANIGGGGATPPSTGEIDFNSLR